MLRRLIRDQKVLATAGAVSFAGLIVLMVISIFDSYEILGINRWIKPMKFCISIALYLWTLMFYLYFVPGRERAKKVIAWGASLLLLGEIVLITMQAARKTTSHFNIATPFDDAVFSGMGTMIVVNTLLIIYLAVIYLRRENPALPISVLWGMRIGLVVFILASIEGGYMSVMLAHSVGVTDGGPGLPLVNWSTNAGDLRAAHFIGMHALQGVPIFAYAMEKLKIGAAAGLTLAFGGLYFAVFVFLFIQALAGRPLWVMI
jgi:hypothetical protein